MNGGHEVEISRGWRFRGRHTKSIPLSAPVCGCQSVRAWYSKAPKGSDMSTRPATTDKQQNA